MKTKKVVVKVDSNVQQENVKNVRRGLKTLQPTDIDKENLAGRPTALKDLKSGGELQKPKPMLSNKETQTEKYITNVDDLTGEEASADYWKRVAEKRQESLDESFKEIEKLKGNIEVLQEENRICKEMLEESRHLVQVFQEMLNEEDDANEEEQEAEPNEESTS